MSVSDVKVWDAPSIGRNDGMSVETKCYQHVVIWADYAKALMKAEDERDEANRVCEQWRQWTVATRADNEALRAEVERLRAALETISRCMTSAPPRPGDPDLLDAGGDGSRLAISRYVDGIIGLPDPTPAALPERIDLKRFQKAPCYICGYNGPNYYQPEVHECAGLYHEQTNEMP